MLSPNQDLRRWGAHAMREALRSIRTAVAAVRGVSCCDRRKQRGLRSQGHGHVRREVVCKADVRAGSHGELCWSRKEGVSESSSHIIKTLW